MKNKQWFLTILVATLVATNGFAQGPNCSGEGNGLLGMVWTSNQEFSLDPHGFIPQTATLYLFNPHEGTVGAVEFRLSYDPALQLLNTVLPSGAVNVGTGGDYIIGFATPLVPDVSGAVALAQFQFTSNVNYTVGIYAEPIAGAQSIPGQMSYVSGAGSTLYELHPIGGDATMIANIGDNDPTPIYLDYCGLTQNQSPTANNDVGSTLRNVGITIDLLANDNDPDGTLDPSSLVLGSVSPGSSLTDLGDGRVVYMPGLFTYEEQFTYTISDNDGAVSNPATVTVSVTHPYEDIIVPDCTGEGQNRLGIIWENNAFSWPDAPTGQTLYGRLYVFNPSGGTVDGFAFNISFQTIGSSVSYNPVLVYPGTFLVEMDPGSFSYILDEPLYPNANGAVPIAEIQVDLGTGSGANFYSESPITITMPPDEQLYTGGDPAPVVLNPLGDDITPIGSLNGEDLGYCQIDGDTTDSAIIIASLPYSDTGSTEGFSNFWDEACPYAGSTSPDVWYTFTPASDVLVDVDLAGSSYDTKTYILDSNMTVVACNDDFYPDYVSKIEGASLTGGTTYFIAVDGYGGGFGSYVINVVLNVPPEPCELTCDGMPEGEPPLGPGYVDAYNGGCNAASGNPFQDLVADQSGNLTFCGISGWSDAVRDTDWFTVTVGATGVVSWTVEAEQESNFYVLSPGDCANVSVLESASVLPCEPYVFTLTGSPGEVMWLWAGPSNFSPPSGFVGNEYAYNMTFSGLEANSVNQAPVIADLGSITTNPIVPEYELDLSPFVTDEEPASELSWQVNGNDDFNVVIIDGIAHIRIKLNGWFGTNTMTFIATDSGGLSGQANLTFTMDSLFEEVVEITLDGETFYAGTRSIGTENFDHGYDQLITSIEPALILAEPHDMRDYAFVRHMLSGSETDVAITSLNGTRYNQYYGEYRAVPLGEFCIYECLFNDNTGQYDCGDDCQYELEPGQFYSLIWDPEGPWANIAVIEETDQVWLRTDTRPVYDGTQEIESWNFTIETSNNGAAPITRSLQFNPSFTQGDSIALKLYDETLGALIDLWPGTEYSYEIPGYSAEIRDFTLFVGTPGATGDTDGDGVPDDVDECPGEDASFFDRNGDGCIDPLPSGRHIEFWAENSFPLEYWIHEGGAPGIGDGSDITAVVEGFSTWTEVQGTEVSATYMGTTTQRVANAFDGINTVTFSDDEYVFPSGVIAVGLSTSYLEADYDNGILPGQIIDTDMIFNPQMPLRTDTAGDPEAIHVKSVVVHEAGHMLGLSHSAVQSSTMFYVLPPDTTAASLEDEDRQALFKAYYLQNSFTGASQLEGTVTDGGTGQPVAGAIVFVMEEATGDTVASDFTLPADGSFHFGNLPDGNYLLAIHPLDGNSAIGYLRPDNINPLIRGTADILFEPEFYDAAESSSDDPTLATPVLVSSGNTTVAHFITNIDTTGPSVVAVSPATGATDVPIDAAVLFRCSEEINPASLVGNFNFAAANGGDFLAGNASLVENGTTLAYVPTVNLEFGTTYLLEVGAGLQDLYGNTMGTDFAMTFTTVTQPDVALANLLPRKSVAGTIIVLNGEGFSGNINGNQVTYGESAWPILEATPSQLVVQVPGDADPGTANVQVQNMGTGLYSNSLTFTVLPPGEEAHGLETAAIDIFALPRQVEIAPDGDEVYIATDQGLTVVDVSNPNAPTYDALTLGNGLTALDVTPAGDRVYAVSQIDGNLHRVDVANLAVLETRNLDYRPRGIRIDPSGRRAYVATPFNEIQVLNIVEGTPNFLDPIGVLTAPIPDLTGAMDTDPAGNILLALTGSGQVLVFDLLTFELIHEIEAMPASQDVVIDPQGERAYVTDEDGQISVISLISFQNLVDIPTGGSLLGVAMDPMGTFLYAVNHELDNLDVIDLRSDSPTYRTISARLPQQTNPVDVAISPDGLYAYCITETDQRLAINTVGSGPLVASLSRTSGPIGAKVVLAGLDFIGATVSFGGLPAPVEQAAESALVVSVPDGAVTGPVMVLGDEPGEVSNAIEYAVLDGTPAGNLRSAGYSLFDSVTGLTGDLVWSGNGQVLAFGASDGSIHLLDTNPNSMSYNSLIGATPASGFPVSDLAMAPDGMSVFALHEGQTDLTRWSVHPSSASFTGLLGTLELGGLQATQLAISPDGSLVVAVDPVTQTGAVVDWANGNIVPVDLPGLTQGVTIHPAGSFAYLGQSGGVGVLDLRSGAGFASLVTSVTLPGNATGLAFHPDGNSCWVLTEPVTGAGNRQLVTLNTSNPEAPVTGGSLAITATSSGSLDQLVPGPAGDRLLIHLSGEGTFLVDPVGDTVVPQASLVDGSSAAEFVFSVDGARVVAAQSATGEVSFFDFQTQLQIAKVWGDGQSAETNQPLGSSLRVRVTDPGTSEGVAGIPVTFTIDTSALPLAEATLKDRQIQKHTRFLPVKDRHHIGLNKGTKGGDKDGGETIDDATPITGLPFSDTGSTAGNTDNYNEVCPWPETGSPDVVYSWVADFSGGVKIDLCGSSYDTRLYVYANEVTPGDPWACNDDFYFGDPCGWYVSMIEDMYVYEDQTYYIVIDGWGGEAGDYNINMTKIYESSPWGYFSVDDPEAQPTTVTLGTNEFGFADVQWNLGVTPGLQTVEVTAFDTQGSPLQFEATALEDPMSVPFRLEESRFAPVIGQADVAVTTTVQIAFNKPFSPSSVTPERFYMSAEGSATSLDAVLGLAGGNTTASLTPVETLEYSTEYTVVIDGQIHDGYQFLTNPQFYTFTTGAAPLAPTLIAANPPSAAPLATVMLTGSGFSPVLGQNQVLFGGVPALVQGADPDFILTRVPLGAPVGPIQVQVLVNGTPTSGVNFFVLEPTVEGADEVVVRVPTQSGTKSATVTPDGALVYAVAPESDLVIPIDMVNFTTLPSIPVGDMPWAITTHPDGKFVYVANRASGDVSVIDIDPDSPTYHQTIESIPVGVAPVDILVTPAGDRVLVANEESQDLGVIDGDPESAAFNSVVNRVPVQSSAKTVTVTPDGARIYVGTDEGYVVIGSVDYGVVKRVDTGSSVRTVTVTPDGALLVLVQTSGELFIFDIAEGSPTEDQVVARVPATSSVKSATVSPDGARLYAVAEEGDLINVYGMEVDGSVGALDEYDGPPPFELVLLEVLTPGENPYEVLFDPSGSGRFFVPNAGDNTVTVYGIALDGELTGNVYAACPEPDTPIPGAQVDIFSNELAELVTTVSTDENGQFSITLPAGPYTVSLMTPLGFSIESEERTVTVAGGTAPVLTWPLECVEVIPNQRNMAWWKHQFAVALRGWGNAQLDGPTLCGYLDNIEDHFNSNTLNQVEVYFPPESDECHDKLLVAKDLLNFWGNWGWEARARQQLMAVLLNVASSRLSLQHVVSRDGATVTQAITFVDHLIDDGDADNDWLAWWVAFSVNVGRRVGNGVIPIDMPSIFYSPVATHFHLDQNYPNPFNPECRIRFGVPRPGRVSLKIFDISGKLVHTLVDENLRVGTYTRIWNGTDSRGLPAASGVYFYRMEAGDFVQTRKMLLMK